MSRIFRGWNHPILPDFSSLEDPRQARGKRYSFLSMLRLCFAGMLGAYRGLRDVAHFGTCLGIGVSYTALYLLLARLRTEDFRQRLHILVRFLFRSKALEPEGFPCHVIAIDNKTLYYGPRKLNAHCQKTHDARTGRIRYHLRVLRAVLTSSRLKTAIDQQVTPPTQNDMSFFAPFFSLLKKLYGRGLLTKAIITLDAGMASLENASLLTKNGNGYVIGLKDNQPSLLAEAKRVLLPRKKGDAEWTTPWEPCDGGEKRYKLFRTTELQGWPTEAGEWSHLRQVLLVVTEVRRRRGRKKKGRRSRKTKLVYTTPKVVKERFFLSNLLWNYLTPLQLLALVRGHWGVENDCNWTTDTQWNEDESPWCRQGEALEVLSLLRLMAYNVVQWLKKRHLRHEGMKRWTWKQWFDWLRRTIPAFLYLPPRSQRIFLTG